MDNILCMYKQPQVKDKDFVTTFNHILSKCQSEYKHCVILGDMNVNMLKAKHCLEETFQVTGCKNVVQEPTCFKSNVPTLIDIIVTNAPRNLSSVKGIDFCLSDVHNMICFSTKAYAPVKQKKYDQIQKFQTF